MEGQVGVHQEDQEWGPGKTFQEVGMACGKGTECDEAWKNWALQLLHSNLEGDLIWKESLCRSNQLKEVTKGGV